MAKAKEFDLDRQAPAIEYEDEKTLAAIDEGIRDAEAGRTVPIEKVRKRLHKWTTAAASPKGRRRILPKSSG
jgi:predicted transcriptional regulator